MAVVAGVLGKAGQKGKQRRLQDAAKGSISWSTSPELTRHMKKEVQSAVVKRKEVMGKMQSNIQGFTEEEQKLMRLGNRNVDLDISEDEMVNMMGETALDDAKEATVRAGEAPSAGSSRLGDIEAELSRAKQQATHIELALTGGKPL